MFEGKILQKCTSCRHVLVEILAYRDSMQQSVDVAVQTLGSTQQAPSCLVTGLGTPWNLAIREFCSCPPSLAAAFRSPCWDRLQMRYVTLGSYTLTRDQVCLLWCSAYNACCC